MATKLDIDALKTLKAIADFGGVTRAADSLAMSQSAVSHKVKRLEQKIGRALLNRRAGEPLLTEDGERLLTYAERILSLHDEALSAIGSLEIKGHVRVGATEDVTAQKIASILARFTRRYPAVSVKVQVNQSMKLIEQLHQHEIDIAIMQLFEHDVEDADTILSVEPLRWVGALEQRYTIDGSLPYVAFDPHCFYRHWALKSAREHGVQLSTVLECPSIAGVTNAVVAGLGVSILNQNNITADMSIIETGLPKPPRIAYVVRMGQQTNLPIKHALIDAVCDEYRQ